MDSGRDVSLLMAVDDYLRGKKQGELVSLTAAIRAVRATVPGEETSDDYVADLVAQKAVALNFNISFDRVRTPKTGPVPGSDGAL